jgi:hypothetical protein
MVPFFLCRREFAYSTSDGQVFVRQFAVSPDDWVLVRTLDGHTAEITQVSRGSILACKQHVLHRFLCSSIACAMTQLYTCKK